MNRKLLIAAIVCAVVALAYLALSRGEIPFFGAGILLEVSFFLAITYLVWLSSLGSDLRGLALLLVVAVVSALSTYLGSIAFGKLDFDLASIVRNSLVHAVLGVGFLGFVWLVDRVAAVLSGRRQST